MVHAYLVLHNTYRYVPGIIRIWYIIRTWYHKVWYIRIWYIIRTTIAVCRPPTKTKISQTHAQISQTHAQIFFLDVAIRNSLRSNKPEVTEKQQEFQEEITKNEKQISELLEKIGTTKSDT